MPSADELPIPEPPCATITLHSLMPYEHDSSFYLLQLLQSLFDSPFKCFKNDVKCSIYCHSKQVEVWMIIVVTSAACEVGVLKMYLFFL